MPTKPIQRQTDHFMPRLVVKSGATAGAEYFVRHDGLLIGRHEQCEIVIADPLVSRRHSRILFDGWYCTIEDLGSTNGTFVNDKRLTAPYILHSGDRVRIADVLLVYTDPQATLTGLKWPVLMLEPPNRVYVNRRMVELSDKEFALIDYLYMHTDQVCSRAELVHAVWPDWQGEIFDYQIESLVRRLRQKIEAAPEEPRFIITVRGKGYQLIKS